MNVEIRVFTPEEEENRKRQHFESLARMGEELNQEWAEWETLTPEERAEQEGVCYADIHFNIYRWQKRGGLKEYLEWWFADGAAGILLFDPEEIREVERTLQTIKITMNQEATEAGKPLPYPEMLP
jgi:hypothetical protein